MRSLVQMTFLVIVLIAAQSVSTAQVFLDTVMVRPVGPGTIHYHVVAPDVPWSIHVLEVDLTNPHVFMESAKANDLVASREIVRSMSERKSWPGHDVIGAINGDFYGGDGTPVTVQVSHGQIVRAPVNRPGLGFDSENRPMIDVVSMDLSVILEDTVGTVQRVNTTRVSDALVLFNSFFGTSTGANEFGTEVLLRPLDPWIVNDTMTFIVDSVESRIGDMSIPAGKAVLSGHGVSESGLLSRISKGDTLRMYQGLSPGLQDLREMIGGYPKLVVNGSDVSYTSPREPRTAAGFSADSSTLYLLAVDGRQLTLSVGMTFKELAQFMIGIGVYQGMNLDGGGSTTMIVRQEVANSPSDGAERAVSNGLLVVSSASQGTLASVSISPPRTRIYRGTSRTFSAFGADQIGNPVALENGLIRFSCDPSIGTIDSVSGLFTASPQVGSGWVFLEYGTFLDSAHVTIKSLGSVRLSPRDIVTDTTRTISFVITAADIDGVQQSVPLGQIHWSVSDTSVGRVTDGIFKGIREGTATVIASVDSVVDSVMVRVELGYGQQILTSFEDPSGWTWSSVYVDSFTVSGDAAAYSEGSGSFRIDYGFTGSSNDIAYVYLDTDIPLYGVPDSIIVDGMTDGSPHRIYYIVSDDDGELFRIYSSRLMNSVGTFGEVRASVAQALPTGGSGLFNFPIRLRRIEMQLVYYRQAGTPYVGTVHLDNLRASYPQDPITGVRRHQDLIPSLFELYQNYPNPFNPETVVEFNVPERSRVSLIVYDMQGRKVRTLLQGRSFESGKSRIVWNGMNDRGQKAASGVYYAVFTSGNYLITRKMILLR